MRHALHYILAFLFFNLSCNQSVNQKTDEATPQAENIKDITPKDIESMSYADYALSEDSQKALENWQKYQELDKQVGYIRNADFSFFEGEQSVVRTFITEFNAGIPESVKTAPILSRITALETMLLKLNSVLRLDNSDKNIQLNAIREFLITVSNLNLQINKKFELDANLVQKTDTIE